MIAVSTLFDLLAANSRRRVLVTLCDVESIDVSAGLLTRGAAAAAPSATHQPGQAGLSEEAKIQRLQLYHAHLPRLESEAVIEWDRETATVSRGPAFADIEPVIRLLATNTHALPEPFL